MKQSGNESGEPAQQSAHCTSYDILADYYDLAFADRSEYVNFYGAWIEPLTCSLLELGCGTGSITSALGTMMRELTTGRGTLVVGVDNSMRMLKRAAARDMQSSWIQGDIRRPPLAYHFDLVVSCFNTFQHLLKDADLLASFRATRSLVARKGLFIFDIYQPSLEFLTRSPRQRSVDNLTLGDGRVAEIRETKDYDADARILTVEWVFVDRASGSQLGRSRHSMRQYFHEDITRLLDASGFAVQEKLGDFDGSPWTPDSKKQFFVCAPS